MRKNVGNQTVAAQLVSATDGSAVTTGTTSVVVTVDGGTQTSVGNATHEGNGTWTMDTGNAANTNGNHTVFTFTNSSAISVAVQAWPQTFTNGYPSVDLQSVGGGNVTASGGRPEVNVTHFSGNAAASQGQSGVPKVDVQAYGGTVGSFSSGTPAVRLGNLSMGGTNLVITAGSIDIDGNLSAGNIDLDAGVLSGAGILAGDISGDLTGNVNGSTASVTGNVTAILANTTHGGAGANLTLDTLTASANALPWNAAWDAEVQSEVNDGLVALGLDHVVSASVTGTDVADNSIVAQLVSGNATADWDTYDNTTDALQALRDRGDAAWTTGAGGTPPDLLQSTTIATLASQTSFTLTAGSADDDAYNGALVVVTDSATSTQVATGTVLDYTGSTKTVTLSADPGIFTMAVGDTIDIIAVGAATVDTAAIADAVLDEALSGHTTAGTLGKAVADIETDATTLLTGAPAVKYNGPLGAGVYYDDGAANTNTTLGTDGTQANPVSTLAAATTLAASLGSKRIYIQGQSTLTLTGQTLTDYDIIGLETADAATVNLGTAASQSVLTRDRIVNCTVYGEHDASDRLRLERCIITDAPAAEVTFLNVFATACAFAGDFEIDTSTDNIFEQCFSGIAGTGYPTCTATGATGTVVFRHYSGGLGLQNLSASHNVSIEGMGQVVFESGCNVNATVAIRGTMTVTDNTAGMVSLSEGARIDRAAINAEADTAITDAALATAAALATVDANVDAILVDTAEIGAAGAGLTEAGGTGDHLTAIPSVGNVTGGINTAAGTITTLDALDTAQDTQHGTTQTAVAAVQADLPATITKGVQLTALPFLMVDATDFATPETGLTVSGTISKDGGAFASLTNSVTEVGNGIYVVTLTAAEMAADTIALRFTATGAADRHITIVTQPT